MTRQGIVVLAFGVTALISGVVNSFQAADDSGQSGTAVSQPAPPAHAPVKVAANATPPKASAASTDVIPYTIRKKNLHDSPIKTQVTLELVVAKAKHSKAALRATLEEIYREIRGTSGFKYHNPPNAAYVYIYSEKDAAPESWIACLLKGADDAKPTLKFQLSVLNAELSMPAKKYGMTIKQRKAVFRASVKCEDTSMSPRGQNEAKENRCLRKLRRHYKLSCVHRPIMNARIGAS